MKPKIPIEYVCISELHLNYITLFQLVSLLLPATPGYQAFCFPSLDLFYRELTLQVFLASAVVRNIYSVMIHPLGGAVLT